MKFVLLVSAILAVAYGGLDPEILKKASEEMHKVAEECKPKTGITDSEIADLKAMKPPSTHEGKCFIACFQKHFGVMTADGKLDKAGGIASLDKLKSIDEGLYEKCVKVMEKCYGEISDVEDPCETALLFGVCLKHGAKESGVEGIFLGEN